MIAWMKIFLSKGEDKVFGPYEEQELLDMLKYGELKHSDLGCLQGQEKWLTIGEILGLAPPPPPLPPQRDGRQDQDQLDSDKALATEEARDFLGIRAKEAKWIAIGFGCLILAGFVVKVGSDTLRAALTRGASRSKGLTTESHSLSLANEPLPPSQPIKFSTELGAVATAEGKVVFMIEGQVDPASGSVSTITKMALERFMTLPSEMTASQASQASEMLLAASEALLAGRSYGQRADNIEVGTDDSMGRRIIGMRLLQTGFLENRQLVFDADNAATAGKILGRASRSSQWLKDKLSALKSD